MATKSFHNYIYKPPTYNTSAPDSDNAGIYYYTHWLNPGTVRGWGGLMNRGQQRVREWEQGIHALLADALARSRQSIGASKLAGAH